MNPGDPCCGTTSATRTPSSGSFAGGARSQEKPDPTEHRGEHGLRPDPSSLHSPVWSSPFVRCRIPATLRRRDAADITRHCPRRPPRRTRMSTPVHLPHDHSPAARRRRRSRRASAPGRAATGTPPPIFNVPTAPGYPAPALLRVRPPGATQPPSARPHLATYHQLSAPRATPLPIAGFTTTSASARTRLRHGLTLVLTPLR